MCSFNDFLEPMDHEFTSIELQLNKVGFKVDGNNKGIKFHCGLNQLKSVDYIYQKKDNFPLVEFSDIGRHQNNIILKIKELEQSNLDRKTRTSLVKEQHRKIHNELVQKYKDTLIIINLLHDHFSDVPDNLKITRFHYYIVVPPLHKEIEEYKIDVVRFLDDLESKITLAMPEQIYERVQVVLIGIFATNH